MQAMPRRWLLCALGAMVALALVCGCAKEEEASESTASYHTYGAAGDAAEPSRPMAKGGAMATDDADMDPGGPPPGMPKSAAPFDHWAAGDEEAEMADARLMVPEMPVADQVSRDGYYESTYSGGYGERDRVAKLIADGVVVDGAQVKLAAFTREYGQSLAIPTAQALSLTAETEQAKTTKNGGKTYLQVGLQATEKEAPRRPPLNIALVIDVSGSMGDEQKLVYARQAALDVVDRLDATDRLALVVYDDYARVPVASGPLTNKERVRQEIRELRPGSATNIHDGLTKGYAEVGKRRTGDGIDSVILVSDGNVTAGPSGNYEFRELVAEQFDDGIQTTTVGVGLDFNEELMMLISRAGKGSYHFVREPSAIPEIFERELGDLTHAVAKAVKVRIVVDEDVSLLRVLGSGQLSEEETAEVKADEKQIDRQVYDDLGITADRQDDDDEPGIKMHIPHFYLGDSHVVLLELQIPKGTKRQRVAEVHVKYKDLVFKKNREETLTATIDRADTQRDVIASTRQPVRKNRLGFETGEALLRAGDLIAQGRPADAAKAIDDRMVALGLATEEWDDKDLRRDHELLGEYMHVVAALAGPSSGDGELGRYLAKSITYSGYELTR